MKKKIETIRKSKHDEIFTLVQNNNKKVVIVVGEYQVITHEFEDFKTAEAYIATKPYKLIFNTMQILMTYAKKNENGAKTETDAQSN